MPNYVFLLYAADDATEWAPGTPAWDEQMALHEAFTQAVSDAGAEVVGGAALDLPRAARTVRMNGQGSGAADRTVLDGPFAETREVLGGIYIIEAADMDTAVALARVCPEPVIEVRPAVG